MTVRAFGTFKRVGDHIFRTEARLQWGLSNKPIGMCVLLNPGSSTLLDEDQWENFEKGYGNEVKGQLKLDATMKALSVILEKAINPREGCFHIANLYNLREAKSQLSLQIYKELCRSMDYEEVLHADFEQIDTFPWIWVGWGVNSDSVLTSRKRSVIKQLSSRTILGIEKPNKTGIDYYHPLPQTHGDKIKYETAMVNKFKDFLTLGERNA